MNEKRDEGWEDTPDGLMPMSEVKKAGYVIGTNGKWTIPGEMYTADGNGDRNAGEQYYTASRQYIQWFNQRKTADSNRPQRSPQLKLKVMEIKAKPVPVSNEDIKISEIPF